MKKWSPSLIEDLGKRHTEKEQEVTGKLEDLGECSRVEVGA